jgi:hypothetical protein
VRPKAADAWVRNRLIAGTVALFVLRLLLSLIRTGPIVVADEIGYLTNARLLSGGIPGQLDRAPFYRGGYSLVLVPLLKLGASPSLTYHLVLALNAALAASLFGLLYVLCTRCAGVSPRVAVYPALAGAVYPAVTVLSQAALSENALFPLTCVWLILACGLLAAHDRRSGQLWAIALGACGAALWAVHGRMLAALVLTAGVLLWAAVRRRARLPDALLGLVVLAVGVWAVQRLNDHLIAHNYGGHAAGEFDSRINALLGFHPLLTTLGNLVGQLWYIVVATFGLVGVVFMAAAQRPGQNDEPDGRRTILVLTLSLTALLLIVSAGAFPSRARPDMLIYGRYVEVVAPVIVALGLAILTERRSTYAIRTVVIALAALTLLVVLVRVTAQNPGTASRWNVSSLPFVTFQLGAGVLVAAAIVACGGAWVLTRIASRAPARVGLGAIGLFIPIVIYGVWNPVLNTQRSVYPSGWTSPQSAASRYGARSLAYDLANDDEIGLYATQWFLPGTRELLFDGRTEPPPSRFVLSSADWEREHPRTGATAVWHDAGRDQVLWRLQSQS